MIVKVTFYKEYRQRSKIGFTEEMIKHEAKKKDGKKKIRRSFSLRNLR